MEELDAILNDLQTIAKDVGFEVPTISATTTGSPASTVDTGFDSASDSYNYSTVKRAPPKTPQVPQLPAPKPVVEEHLSFGGDFGLDKILASLDELENKHEPQKTTQPQTSQVRHVSFKSEQPPPPTPPKPSVKPMPPSRPRPSPKPSFTQQHQPIIKPEPIVSSPAPAPTPPALVKMHHHGTLEREKPPPPATPPRTDVKYGTNPRLMTGHAPQPLANIFRNQLSAKKMERTSSYSSDHSDRSGSSSVGPPPPHSPSSSSGGGAYRLSFPPPGRMPPPPMTTTTTAPTMSYHQHQMDMQMAPPPPPPPMDQHLASEKNTERIQIFSNEGSYKWLHIERQMAARYVTQLVAEKHRTRFTVRHSLLEYNPQLATERILEEDEKVVEVVNQWGDQKNELHFVDRRDKWLLFANPQVLMDRATAERPTSREERHQILEQWFPPNQDPRYPGDEGSSPRIGETVQIKDDKKNKWKEKYIELRRDKLFIFKKESNREKQPEDIIDIKQFLVYRSINWQKHFKSPLPYGVCIKMGHVQNFGQCKKGSPTERIKFIALENEFSELKWVTALRLVKNPKQMFLSYRATLATVGQEQRPSSLLSLRPASLGPVMGPLPSATSRPSSVDSNSHDHVDGFHHDNRPHYQHARPAPQQHQHHHHGVKMRHQPPMTRYYEQPMAPQQQPHQQQPPPHRINDFPPPPAFITEIKDISRRAQLPNHSSQSSSNNDDFGHLPPPPPELILQEARNNNVENGYRTISNRPRPPPPRRHPGTRLMN